MTQLKSIKEHQEKRLSDLKNDILQQATQQKPKAEQPAQQKDKAATTDTAEPKANQQAPQKKKAPQQVTAADKAKHLEEIEAIEKHQAK